MGASFLAGYCGIDNLTINNSAAYLANWLDTLKNDSRMVLVAASQAQKAADLILGVAQLYYLRLRPELQLKQA